MIGEYMKRANNHQELVSNLKELNGYIRAASNLRLGKASKAVVASARNMIRQQTTEKIQTIFEKGHL